MFFVSIGRLSFFFAFMMVFILTLADRLLHGHILFLKSLDKLKFIGLFLSGLLGLLPAFFEFKLGCGIFLQLSLISVEGHHLYPAL